jgi:hypothetical protein
MPEPGKKKGAIIPDASTIPACLHKKTTIVKTMVVMSG